MKTKIPVGILGATGLLGNYYLHLLRQHPWFEVSFLGGSQEGSFEERAQEKWHLPHPIPSGYYIHKADALDEARKRCSFVFSALPAEQATRIEPLYASAGIPVISSASSHRLEPDVPLLIPEVNPEHLLLIDEQKAKRGWKGFLVAKPNCALQSFVIPLTPLHHKFRIQRLSITTLQAMSGAGVGGLSSLAIQDNVIPFIKGEEEKLEQEPLKIWGKLRLSTLIPARDLTITSHCTRVPVLDGHMACISVSFETKPTEEDILSAWNTFASPYSLPSAPLKPILYRHEDNRPQTRLDRDSGEGMSITVGRLRTCPLLDYRFVGLAHNAIRGGAGGGILIAELLHQQGRL